MCACSTHDIPEFWCHLKKYSCEILVCFVWVPKIDFWHYSLISEVAWCYSWQTWVTLVSLSYGIHQNWQRSSFKHGHEWASEQGMHAAEWHFYLLTWTVYVDLMICNDTLRGVPLLLLANKQDLEVSCFILSLVYADL